MLVINRTVGKTVVIIVDGRKVEVSVLSNGQNVKLGFNADKDIVIDRLEVHERKLQGIQRK